MRQVKLIAAGLMVALAAGMLGATPGAPPAGPASAPVPQDPFTRELLGRLNSGDPAQKSAAQEQLAAIAGFWQQIDMLQKMLEATADPELKGLLQQRINELKIRQAQLDITNLPPVSLNVKTVNLTQLADALSAALGTPGKLQAPNGGQGLYTLDMKNKPFWEVFAALAQQEPFTFSNYNTGLRLQNSGTPLRRYAVDGPVIGYVDMIQYRRMATLQTPGGDPAMQPPQLTATLYIGVDPRIRVSTLTGPTVTRATDDAGNTFTRNGGNSVFNDAMTNMFNTSITLQAPENPGKKLALSLDGRITAQATEIVGTLSDVANQLNTPVAVGGRSFRMQRFVVNGTTVNMSIMMDATAQPTDAAPRATAVLLDGTGKQLWTGPITGSIAGSFAVGDSTGPYKLEVHVPDKTVEIPFHLELKDMPLP